MCCYGSLGAASGIQICSGLRIDALVRVIWNTRVAQEYEGSPFLTEQERDPEREPQPQAERTSRQPQPHEVPCMICRVRDRICIARHGLRIAGARLSDIVNSVHVYSKASRPDGLAAFVEKP